VKVFAKGADMRATTTKPIRIEVDFPPDVFAAMKMVGLYGDRLEREVKSSIALSLFKKGLLSIGKAAELADMCLADFMDFLVVNGVPVVEYTLEDLKKDTEAFERLRQ
jgi:predicted HTH domain antitoxin